MIFTRLPLEGAFLVAPERHADERGYFARTYCRKAFADNGLRDTSLQCSVSFNARAGTLRGLHFQRPPNEETKLVRCVRGAVWDVIVDLVPGSPTFARWHGERLDADSGLALYVPAGFAHGFVTLTDATELLYQMAEPFVASAADGVVWNDPDLGINWPIEPRVVSARDLGLPRLKEVVG